MDDAIVGIVVILIGVALALALALIPLTFYYLCLSKCLQVCHEENRYMSPGKVWLNFIPFFACVYIFFTVSNISKSIVKEYESLGIKSPTTGGKGIGIAYAVLSAIGIIPYLNIITGVPCLICWIIHWVRISSCSNEIERANASTQNIV